MGFHLFMFDFDFLLIHTPLHFLKNALEVFYTIPS